MNINELIMLVQKKNDLNRRRRRFYYRMSEEYIKSQYPTHKQKAFHLNGYIKAQNDMKAMTKMMRKARTEIDAKFVWNDGGMISDVIYQEKYINHSEYKRYVDAHCVETILLRSK